MVLLDLHDHEPKEALRSLKCHLTSLSGIAGKSLSYSLHALSWFQLGKWHGFLLLLFSAIPRLKVFVGSNENDTKREARKKRVRTWRNAASIMIYSNSPKYSSFEILLHFIISVALTFCTFLKVYEKVASTLFLQFSLFFWLKIWIKFFFSE